MPEDRLGLEKAYDEARILHDKIAPEIKKTVTSAANDYPNLKTEVAPLGDTGYLELGAQRLAQLEQDYPDYYYALKTRQAAIDRLAEALRPPYSDIQHYLNERIAHEEANSLSQKDQLTAEEKARHTANVTVRYITSNVLLEAENAHLPYTDLQMLPKVSTAIQKELEDGHVLQHYKFRAQEIGSLTEAVLASLEVASQEKQVDPVFRLDLRPALAKQAKYDQATHS